VQYKKKHVQKLRTIHEDLDAAETHQKIAKIGGPSSNVNKFTE
jgi:hypothetical protein